MIDLDKIEKSIALHQYIETRSRINNAVQSSCQQLQNSGIFEMIETINKALEKSIANINLPDFSEIIEQVTEMRKKISAYWCDTVCDNCFAAPESVEEAQSSIQEVKEIVQSQNTDTYRKLTTSDIIAILGIILTLFMWAIDKVTDATSNGENQTMINNYYSVALEASALLDEINKQTEINSYDAS